MTPDKIGSTPWQTKTLGARKVPIPQILETIGSLSDRQSKLMEFVAPGGTEMSDAVIFKEGQYPIILAAEQRRAQQYEPFPVESDEVSDKFLTRSFLYFLILRKNKRRHMW